MIDYNIADIIFLVYCFSKSNTNKKIKKKIQFTDLNKNNIYFNYYLFILHDVDICREYILLSVIMPHRSSEYKEQAISLSLSLWLAIYKEKKKKKEYSAAGNRTPVSRVTGGDTNHYTTADITHWLRIRSEYC